MTIIGSCSNCGGDVVAHTEVWIAGAPPPPTCRRCGATPALPVIAMGPPAVGGGDLPLLTRIAGLAETVREQQRQRFSVPAAQRSATGLRLLREWECRLDDALLKRKG